MVGEDGAAEEVVAAVGAVDSFAVVGGVVDELSVDSEGGFVLDEGLVEVDLVGVVVDGGLDGQAHC
mgnify:CR=1 FL=1